MEFRANYYSGIVMSDCFIVTNYLKRQMKWKFSIRMKRSQISSRFEIEKSFPKMRYNHEKFEWGRLELTKYLRSSERPLRTYADVYRIH